ncbi:MAG: hypothetical protein ABFD54_04130 [Armatimonadota bacterium]|nr:hypothetical protein [bacterium]
MSRWHNHYEDGYAHFCTSTISDWQPLLQGEAVTVLYEEWNAARDAIGVKVLAYVIMPNHYHIMLWSEYGDQIAKFQRRTLSKVAPRIKVGGGLWKERPRVLPVRSESLLRIKVDYLHRNPLRKGLVVNPEDWPHSSFRQLVLGHHDAQFVCDDWGQIFIR